MPQVIGMMGQPMGAQHIRKFLRTALLAAAVLAISQVLFWAMVTLAERQARPADLASRPFVEFQVLDQNNRPIDGGKRFKATYQGTSGYRADASREGATDLFSIPFEVARADEQIALFMAIRENLKEVKVNGVIVQPDVPLSELQGRVTSEPAYFLLPANALRPGTNLLTISKEHRDMVSAFPEFSVGPAQELAQAYRWKSRFLVDIPLAGIAILAFTIALCAAVNWPAEDRQRMRWLIAFLASSMLFTLALTFLPISDRLPLSVSMGLLVVFHIAISTSLAKFVAFDVGAPGLVHRGIFWVSLISGTLLFGLYLTNFLSDSWYEWSLTNALFYLLMYFFAITVLCTLTLCWAVARNPRDGWLERMVVIVCLTTFGMDRLSTSFDIYSPFDPTLPISLYWSPIVGALLGLGMVLAIARQASEARRTVAQSNEILAARLDEQDAELARSYDAQKQMLQRQVMLVERQRIVRDMHDGIGGQLLGLMMQVRSGGVDPAEVEQGLQASIADLRLIVDSMDSAEEGLAETLRAFEHRVRSQIEAGGMALDFVNNVSEAIDLGPRPTLQVLRILQEAVTNAMRHSGARRIAVTSIAADGEPIRITIADDGAGLAPGYRRGRGLTSMETRARNLGGTLTISTGSHGTQLRLELPLTEEALAE